MRRPLPRATVTTIGVYGWTLEAFLDALHRANVGLLLDVRQRRGVRGSEYAWANAARLQAAVAAAGIEYRHHKELAPTTELRHVQYREDARRGVGKRSRVELAPEYRERYTGEILDPSISPRSSPRCPGRPRPPCYAWSRIPAPATGHSSPSDSARRSTFRCPISFHSGHSPRTLEL